MTTDYSFIETFSNRISDPDLLDISDAIVEIVDQLMNDPQCREIT